MRLRYLFIIRGDFVHCFDGLETHEGKVALASFKYPPPPGGYFTLESESGGRLSQVKLLTVRPQCYAHDNKKWKMCTKDEGAVRQKK